MLHRRGFLTGVFSAFAAPAIVRVESIMPVKAMPLYEELTAITRKVFVPRLFIQLYHESPELNLLTA
jgi:hypothetical protein